MFEITAKDHFDAAHFLRGYNGKCANIHGHRWQVEVSLQGPELNELGILVDFMDVKSMLKEVMEVFDHKMVNDVPPFDRLNPTAENIARFVYEEMSSKLNTQIKPGIVLTRATVWESESASSTYFAK